MATPDLANRVFDLHIELFLKFVETDPSSSRVPSRFSRPLKPQGSRSPLPPLPPAFARCRAWSALTCWKYFDSITCGDEIENGNSAPDIFVESARRLRLRSRALRRYRGIRWQKRSAFGPRLGRPRVHDSRYRGAHARNRGDVHCGPADPARIARRDRRCERFTGASPRIAPGLESGFKFCPQFWVPWGAGCFRSPENPRVMRVSDFAYFGITRKLRQNLFRRQQNCITRWRSDVHPLGTPRRFKAER